MTETICGVDVSAETLDASIGRSGPWQKFANTPEGVGELATFARANNVTLVVMEATGGYERKPFALLWGAKVPCAIANPRAVRRFAEAMGALEKTDRIDCSMIAWYGQTKRIEPTPPASAIQQQLTAAVLRLRQLTELRVAQTNQRRLVTDDDVQASFQPILAAIANETRKLENRITTLIAADPLWEALDKVFREIKGVSDRTVARVMAELPEIGTLSNKAVAKLAGLAPIAHDSGKHTGKRPVRGGREGVRSILFVVAEIVRRHEPDLKDFHQRLSKAGKPKKVVRTAVAHKLLVRLNAKARDARNELAKAA